MYYKILKKITAKIKWIYLIKFNFYIDKKYKFQNNKKYLNKKN